MSRAAAGPGTRVLLVGGSGCLGSHAAVALRAAGHAVTVLARSRPSIVADQILIADRDDAGALAAALRGQRFDLTVDFLGFDAADVERLIGAGPAALGHVVLISSGQVYLVGAGAAPPYPEEASETPLMDEPPAHSADHGEWRYGAAKRRAEQALHALAARHGLRATALRLPIVQGAGDRTLRLWAWLERLRDGGPLLLPERGSREVRFVWAGDVARALARLAARPEAVSPALNLAPTQSLTLREFLERLARAAEVRPRFVDVSWEELDAASIPRAAAPYAGRWVSVLDSSRAARELSFEATPLASWLPEVVRAHLEAAPGRSHPGYVARARELDLALRLGAGRAGVGGITASASGAGGSS